VLQYSSGLPDTGSPWDGSFYLCKDGLVLLLTSLLTIALARQSGLDTALLTGLQVVGMTLDFLDDVFLLNLPLKPAESIL